MNIFGHAYIAYKVIGYLNPYVVAGSDLSDLIPFIPSEKYPIDMLFRSIHEGGEAVLKHNRDLGLAMLCHSVTYGADQFNKDIDTWIFRNDTTAMDVLARKIADCSNIPFEVARFNRFHNYLWVGCDIYIMRAYPDFIHKLQTSYAQIQPIEIAHILACSTKLDNTELLRMTQLFFSQRSIGEISDLETYSAMWKNFLAQLPDKDSVNIEKAVPLFEEIYTSHKAQWPIILKRVLFSVRKNLSPYL